MLANMGYQGHGSLTSNKNALAKTLSHTQGRDARKNSGLAFGLEDDMPMSTRNVFISSDSEDDDPPFVATTLQDEDFVPTISLLLGEDTPNTTNDVEASTS